MWDTRAALRRSLDAHGIRGQGKPAHGQVLIVNSQIDGSYDSLTPWGPAATTSCPYKANALADRQLNDTGYNRLWEYNTRRAK